MYTFKHLRMVENIDIPIPWRPLYNDWHVLSLQIFTITTLSAYIGFNRQKVIQKLETLFLRIYSISTLADPQLGNKNKRNVSKTNFSSVFTQYVYILWHLTSTLHLWSYFRARNFICVVSQPYMYLIRKLIISFWHA